MRAFPCTVWKKNRCDMRSAPRMGQRHLPPSLCSRGDRSIDEAASNRPSKNWQLMTFTKRKFGLISGIALAAAAIFLALQYQAGVRLREENQSLRQQLEQLNQVAEENERLSNLVARANSPQTNGPLSELLRLRAEVSRLRKE